MLKKVYPLIILLVLVVVIVSTYFLFSKNKSPYVTMYQGRAELNKDLLPQISVELPQGWKLETYNKHVESGNIIYKGTTDIALISDGVVIFYLNPVGDTGGAGGTYFKFPDYDPNDYAKYKDADPEFVDVVDVKEGEYSEITLFNLEVRRIGHELVPNISEDSKYFISPMSPVLFTFGEPSFDWYDKTNVIEKDQSTYGAYINPDATESQLKELDTILNSMKLK